MLLTRRALALLLLSALLLIGATWATILLYVAIGYLVFVFGMIAVDRALSPRPRDFVLTRTNEPRLSLGAENRVTVRAENRSPRAVRGIVRDEYPVQFRADRMILASDSLYHALERDGPPNALFGTREQNSPLRRRVTLWLSGSANSKPVLLVPRAAVEFAYHLRPPRRGDYAFGDLNLRWWGVLGLIVCQARYPAATPVKVYPNLLDIRKYELQARKGQLIELGLRQTRMLGSGTEFERLRDYQLDDEYRRIDWKATARRGKPVSREFETERSQPVFVLLDVGRLMRSPVGDLAKLDYAVNAALMLSYVATLRGDRVGLLAFADEVTHYVSPRAGRGQFYRILSVLYGVESQPVESNYARAFGYLGAKYKKRSLIVVFSDLASGIAADSIVKQVAPLSPRHLPLFVAIGDPTVIELAAQPPRNSANVYERAVAEQLLDERVLTLEKLHQRGVLTLDVPANRLTVSVVNRYLELKARGRI